MIGDLRRYALLWLAGADLRLTLLAIPPVLPLIHRDLLLDEKGVAALTGLPLLLLGLAATPGSLLIARIGARRALLTGITLIGVGSGLRGVGPSTPVLFAATLAMGAGISICQPSLPALVRQWFPSTITRATAAWSNGLLIGELIGASLTIPLILPLAGGSWELALGLWAIPVLISALLVAAWTSHDAAEARYYSGAGVPDWGSRRLWQMGIFQSSSALVYFGVNSFIPDYLNATGQSDLIALLLAIVNSAQVPASFVIGLVPWRILSHRLTSYALAAAIFGSLAALMSGQPVAMAIAAGVFGFAAAFILVFSFALPALLAEPVDVSRVSAGMFTISYTTSFAANLAAGAIWDATHVAATAFLPVMLGGVVVLALGPGLSAASRAPQRTSPLLEEAA